MSAAKSDRPSTPNITMMIGEVDTLTKNFETMLSCIEKLTKKFFDAKINRHVDLKNHGEMSWFNLDEIELDPYMSGKRVSLECAIHISEKEIWLNNIDSKHPEKKYIMVTRPKGKTVKQCVLDGNFIELSKEEVMKKQSEINSCTKLVHGSITTFDIKELTDIPTSMYTIL